MIRAVLFDLDGVLIDSYEVWFHLTNAAARDFEAEPISRALFQDCWGQGLQADVERFYPGRSVAEVEAYYARHFLDHAAHLEVDPSARDVLDALRAGGIATAVITNTPGGLARAILARAGLHPDTVVGGTDVGRPKPAPDMVLAACRHLEVAPARVLVVGDSDYDRAAARAAAVRFAGLGIEGDATLGRLADVLGLVSTSGAARG